jgi:NADPH-dependent curcumin reductase CurA
VQLTTRIVLASRPTGRPAAEHFRLETVPLPTLGEHQVLVRNDWLSIDPYMRGRMMDIRTYAEPVGLGEVMVGDTAGEVIASRDPAFAVGDQVVGILGWQRHAAVDGARLRRVDAARLPLQAYLGVAGMPGVTAFVGMVDLCEPKPGETVVVTAASGAVGGTAGQLARLRGCRVVGVAGGAGKCRHVVDDLGFDACVDYKADDFKERIAQAVPDGIDAIFDNVGGEILATLLGRVNHFARIALCGAISELDNPQPHGLKRLLPFIVNRVRLQGFIVSDHAARWPAAIDELSSHVAAGRMRTRESIAEGLAAAPAALIGLFEGRNLGKQLVRLG